MLPAAAMPVAILMPAYNEPETLAETLRAVRARADELGGLTVFLVDDGSDPPIDPAELPSPTAAFRLILGRHEVNLGQGAALETARQLALRAPVTMGGLRWGSPAAVLEGPLPQLPPPQTPWRAAPFVAYVTMDADGQHRTEDLRALVAAIEAGADVALGNRFLGDSNVPAARRALIHAARIFERAVTGLRLSDAHNGYRAFGRRALEQVVIRENRMAHATELTRQLSRARAGERLSVVEVPVSVRYTRQSLAKGQTSLGAFTILRDLFYRYLFEEQK
jgi:glycosyltransferase involved in cell wall biosynthesis